VVFKNGRRSKATRYVTVVAVSVVAIVASACSSSGGGDAGASSQGGSSSTAALHSVKIGFVGQLAGYWPFWAAQQEGYLASNGLKASLTYIATDSNLTAAAISGSVDVIGEVPEVLYLANKNGGDMRMFCGLQNTPLYSIIAGKGISAVSDLKGKKIAVSDATSGGDAFVARAALAAAGLNSSDYTLTNAGAQASRVAAVKSGAVAATLVNAPFNAEAIADGLTDLGETTSSVPHLQWTGLAATKKWLVSHADIAKSLCKAVAQGSKFVLDPSNMTKAVADLQTGTGLTAEAAKAQYTGVNAGLMGTFTKDGSMDSAGFATWGSLTGVDPSQFTALEDKDYLPSS
jgi:NitT/TauT family transport system substrate-binding protein